MRLPGNFPALGVPEAHAHAPRGGIVGRAWIPDGALRRGLDRRLPDAPQGLRERLRPFPHHAARPPADPQRDGHLRRPLLHPDPHPAPPPPPDPAPAAPPAAAIPRPSPRAPP